MTPRPRSRTCCAAETAGCRRSRSLQTRTVVATIKDPVTPVAVAVPPNSHGAVAPNRRRPAPPSNANQALNSSPAPTGTFTPVPPSGGPTPPPGGRGRGRRPPPNFVGNVNGSPASGGSGGVVETTPECQKMSTSSQSLETPRIATQRRPPAEQQEAPATPRLQAVRKAEPNTPRLQTARQTEPATPRLRTVHRTEPEMTVREQRFFVTLDTDEVEIRTKLFRMGVPLLRSTIPLQSGTRRQRGSRALAVSHSVRDGSESDSDAESVLSVSEAGSDDVGSLAVTFDFSC